MFIKLGKYEKAIFYLKVPLFYFFKIIYSIKKLVDEKGQTCLECYLAYGDALVLYGKYRKAIEAYETANKINTNNEISVKKTALLKCFLNVYESMENQHINLLGTINEVEDYQIK